MHSITNKKLIKKYIYDILSQIQGAEITRADCEKEANN